MFCLFLYICTFVPRNDTLNLLNLDSIPNEKVFIIDFSTDNAFPRE